jgi:[acyl-carrier-protein] S-malonyltransferase
VLALVAPGQGSQTPGMLTPWISDSDSRQLLATWSEAIDLDLIHLGTQADADEIRDTANAQPLIVAAGLLSARALGVDNDAAFMAGHSVGEIRKVMHCVLSARAVSRWQKLLSAANQE